MLGKHRNDVFVNTSYSSTVTCWAEGGGKGRSFKQFFL